MNINVDIWVIVSITLSLAATSLLLRSPYLRITSLGWFIAIWSLPFAGALFFLLTVVRARRDHHDQAFCALVEQTKSHSCQDNLHERLGMEHDFLPYNSAEDLTLIRDDAFVDAVCEAIDQSTSRVWIATYIFSGDVKEKIIERLLAAHKRGVDVKLLIDRVGSGLLLKSRQHPLGKHIPFDVSVFHQSRFKALYFIEKRLHSKIVLADRCAIVGAHNLRDEVRLSHESGVHNISVKFTGSVTTQLDAVFIDLWLLNTGDKLHALENEPEANETQANYPTLARIIHSDPIERSHNYNDYLATLFSAARQRICIWMPYMIPTQAMRRTLISASRIGLDVRVLIPKKTDSFLVDNSHDLVLKELTDNGVSCALSEQQFDHSKILIIDDLTVIGSTNLDYRSLYRNYEANLEVKDVEFNQRVLTLFDAEFSRGAGFKGCKKHSLVHMKNQLTSLIAGLY